MCVLAALPGVNESLAAASAVARVAHAVCDTDCLSSEVPRMQAATAACQTAMASFKVGAGCPSPCRDAMPWDVSAGAVGGGSLPQWA